MKIYNGIMVLPFTLLEIIAKSILQNNSFLNLMYKNDFLYAYPIELLIAINDIKRYIKMKPES